LTRTISVRSAWTAAFVLAMGGAQLLSAHPAHAAAPAGNPSGASGAVTAIRFGHLVDGKGHSVRQAVVIVQGERIRAAGTAALTPIPAGANVIDLSGYTGIPGLIDAHTHMTYYWDGSPGATPWEQLANRPEAETVFLAQENAKRTLETGVTTVRDLGSWAYMDISLRNLINRGAVVGPRMFVAGYGLHTAYSPYRPGYAEPDGGLASGPAEMMRIVRENIAAGADVIKIFGSTGSGEDVSGSETFTYEELKAAVDAARARGKRVAIHSYGPDGARDAVRAGATSIEHSTGMDEATMHEMARRGIFYVPTIDHNRYYAEQAAVFHYDSSAVAGLNAYRSRNLETLRRAVKAGVKIAMGSDAVFTMFGENTRELGWFVQAGMTPAQALATATANGAALLGMEKDLGAVAPGYYADLVAVEGDPLTNIDAVIHRVRWVMKGGQVVVDKTGAAAR
jgi:imidazolonepropionase-like amidohydrolase